MTLDPTLQVFFDEAFELLRAFEEGILGLERTPEDQELLHSVFRAAHTIKGNSGMLGFERIAGLAHALEDLLSRLRSGERQVTPAIVTILLRSGDSLRTLLTQAREGDEGEVEGLDDLTRALASQASGVEVECAEPPARETPAPVSRSRTLYEIRFEPASDLLRRGLDPMRILDALGTLGEMLRVQGDARRLPSLDALEPDQVYLGFTTWLMSRAPRSEIEGCFEFVDQPGAIRIEALDMDDAAAEVKPAETRRSDGGAVGTGRAKATAEADVQSIRVGTDKIDRLVNLVGELVITQSMVAQLVDRFTPDSLPRLREAVAEMDHHSRELQERVMAVRMLPIRTVFARFARVVRDLAQSLGKRVDFETCGEETELDKTVIERIGDPMTHLVRNAVDHGIETPEIRRQVGKPEAGRLVLSAYQKGGSIYIEIQDDGRGLDRDRVLAKAIDQGLVSPGDNLSDEQVHNLIFRPGFSTAASITEVSGRGVGLDVVKRNVETLGGAVTIQSSPGHGTTFRIKLPLTLAIVEGQLLRVGNEVYVLPLVAITESVRPTREALSTVFTSGETFSMRGEVLPLLRLHRIFGVTGAIEDARQALTVVVEHEGRRTALLVDELLGQQQVVIKSLGSNFKEIEGVSGATILGDGRVALILDVPGLLALASPRQPAARQAALVTV